jgi:DNA-binding GntR family transcriptional regulator
MRFWGTGEGTDTGMGVSEKRAQAKAPQAWERVYEYVREQILSGRIQAGLFLEEEQVCAAVGVSRTPVREAFHRLERDRFLDLLPRRGALIRAVTVQELVHLYETRRMIEAHVMRRIAEERLCVPDALDALLAGLAMPQTWPDVRFQAEGDFTFHRTLVATLGNEVMLEVFDALQWRQQRVAMRAIGVNPQRMAIVHAQHTALLAALRAGDAAEAVAILTTHLQPAIEVTSRLQGDEGDFPPRVG